MTNVPETLVEILLLSGMLLSLLGLIVPFFPGVTVIWVLALLQGVISGFGWQGWVFVGILTLLALFGWIADNALMGAKARQSGAHWLSLIAALVTGFVGSLFLTPLGGLLVALATVFLIEYAYSKKLETAWHIFKQTLTGWGWAFVVRFVAGLLMIGVWGLWALLG
jgi:hypothetical protein